MSIDVEGLLVDHQDALELFQQGFKKANVPYAFSHPQMWEEAAKFFRQARYLFESPIMKRRCTQWIRKCTWLAAGVFDYTNCECGNPACTGIGYWLAGNDKRISKREALRIVNAYKIRRKNPLAYTPTFGKRRKPKKGVRIKDIMYGIFKEKGLDISFEYAKKKVLTSSPDSKFNEKHLSYYRSMYKKET